MRVNLNVTMNGQTNQLNTLSQQIENSMESPNRRTQSYDRVNKSY